jgi:predicted  nucleic acid-binding Zn-ribbon protein
MSWLFGSKPVTTPTTTFGVVASSKVKNAVKIDEIEKRISGTSDKLKTEMTKYKQIAALNKKLTESYVTNYYVMVDISKLLKDYSEIFDKLSVVLQKYDQIEISPIDMDHLKNITKAKLDEINGDFSKQTNNIRSLYTKYNMGSELTKLSAVDPLTKNVGSSVDDILNKLKGGSKTVRKTRKTRKQ